MSLMTCPPSSALEHLFLGGLPENEVEALEQHVLECKACLERLKALVRAKDTLAGLPHNATRNDPYHRGPVVDDLLKRLESLHRTPAAAPPGGSPMISISCLACQKKLSVKDTLADKEIKCPGCGQMLAVPAKVAAAPSQVDDRTLPPGPGSEPSGQEVLSAPPADAAKDPTKAPLSKPDATWGTDKLAADHDSSLTDFLSPPQADDELGRLGKYRILKVLGHGGMGVVYKAEDPKLKRFVALKAMLPTLAASASAGQRFLREAQAMAAVEHDHIVRVHQVDEERGVPFLAMEFLKGEPLDERLKREEKLPLAEVLRIGREIAEGLGAAHATGLIHRDIKPGNIWLEAPRNRVKILDFGLARATSEDAGLTQQGAIIGTPAYMAPEQGRGDPVDARSDLFSLGVVLYRLCCGQQPFQGKDTVSTLMAVAMHDPAPPITLNAELPPALSDLVMKLLAKDPAKRVASAGEAVEILQALERRLARQKETGEPTAAGVSVLRGNSGPRRGRPLPLVIGALGLLLVGLLGAWAAGLIRFHSDEGAYVIETDDPDFSFAVAKGGVTLEDRKTNRKYNVKVARQNKASGELELEVTDPGADLSFKTPSFTIKRGEKVALKAWFERKQAAAGKTPGRDDGWLEEVAALPTARQVDAVAAKLKERNPGFDGKVTHKIEDGAVTEVQLLTHHVTDLSPVRALPGLRRLECSGTEEKKGALDDLSPLQGLKLTALACGFTKVADLSPLKGMQLTVLRCESTSVTDLSPLKGMPLKELTCDFRLERDGEPMSSFEYLDKINGKSAPAFWAEVDTQLAGDDPWLKEMAALPGAKKLEVVMAKLKELNPGFDGKHTCKLAGVLVIELGFHNNTIKDISPVRALTWLRKFTCVPSDPNAIGKSQLADLSPLKVLKLTDLDIGFNKVADLSPLKNVPLTRLACHWNPVRDLSPLKGMPLTTLDIYRTEVRDLSPLKGMPLTTLSIGHTPVTDLTPLENLKLASLDCRETSVSNLTPLKDLKLTSLTLSFTSVSNLTPLKDMPLTSLSINDSFVSDLTPLKGMPLRYLGCAHTNVSDLTPLQGIPLKVLWCDFEPERDGEILRLIKTLETINTKPAAEFWKKENAKKEQKKP